MTYNISEEVQGRLVVLETREKVLTKHLKRLSIPFSVTAALTAAGGGLARFLGPDARLSSIDVPATVLELFSASSIGGGAIISGAITSISSQLLSFLTSFEPVFVGFGIIGIIVGGFKFIYGESAEKALHYLIPSAGLAMSVPMMLFILGNDLVPGSGRDEFVMAVENHRFEEVRKQLEKVKQELSPGGLYVLAQVSIAEGKGRLPINEVLIREVLSPSAGFAPKKEALYAIEVAAYGTPVSVEAVAYQDKHIARQRAAQVGAVIFGGLWGVICSVGLGVLALRHTITRRLRRIHHLLGFTNMIGSSVALETGQKLYPDNKEEMERATMFDKGTSLAVVYNEGKAINPFQPLNPK